MVLALLGADRSPLAYQGPGHKWCPELAHVGQLGSAAMQRKRGGKQEHPSVPPPLANLVL